MATAYKTALQQEVQWARLRVVQALVPSYRGEEPRTLLTLDKDPKPTEESGSQQYAFINILYKNSHVRDQFINISFAGEIIKACLLIFQTFRLLVRYSTVLVKVRREIKDVFGNEQSVTRTHVRNMHYLDCVPKETLQLYPPVLLGSIRKDGLRVSLYVYEQHS